MGDGRADATQLTRARRSWPLIVRRARAGDERAVRDFATRTWNDWDYLPHAFPRWLDAADGVLLVGVPGSASDGSAARDANGSELEPDRPLAVVRVALLSPGEAWLEGIRVDPRVRGMDVATDLQVAELQWAAAQRARVVRYATGAGNEGSHRLGARGGFELLVTLRSLWWSATGNPRADDAEHAPSGFLPEVQAAAGARRARLLDRLSEQGLIAPADEGGLWPRLARDAGFLAAQRLYEPRPWALEELTEPKLRGHLARGEVAQVADGDRWAAAIIVRRPEPAEDAALRFALLAGDGSAALSLAEAARELAGEVIRVRVAAEAPLLLEHKEAFGAAGYVSPDRPLHVLSRPLDEAHPPPVVDPATVVLADQPEPILRPSH